MRHIVEQPTDSKIPQDVRDLLERSGVDPDNLNPNNELSIGELKKMVDNGALGEDGIVISGDHGGPIPPE